MEFILSRILIFHIFKRGTTSTFIRNKLVSSFNGTEVCVSTRKYKFSNLLTFGFSNPGKLLNSG